MLARCSEPLPASGLFSPEELELLGSWFSGRLSAAAARILARRRPRPPALSSKLDAAIGAILLESLPLRAPMLGAMVRADAQRDGGLVFAVRPDLAQAGLGSLAPATRDLLCLCWGRRVFAYGITPLPGTGRVVLTVSVTPETGVARPMHAAIGWIDGRDEFIAATGTVLRRDWQRRRDLSAATRWSAILDPGLLDAGLVTAWADGIWPD